MKTGLVEAEELGNVCLASVFGLVFPNGKGR